MALEIRVDYPAVELRRFARRETNGRVASRLQALANALSGMSHAQAADAAGMDRQTLRDWVVHYNAEGLAGLRDRPKGHPEPRLSEGEQGSLANVLFRGPDPDRDGLSAWTLPALRDLIETRFAKRLHPAGLSRILRANGFSRQKARASHPRKDAKAQERFKKGGLAQALRAARVSPGQADRAVAPRRGPGGQTGRTCHLWWAKGRRPPGLCDQRFEWAYIFGAVEPATGKAFSLVLPYADAAMMSLFLAYFARTIEDGVHVVMVHDGAGWHAEKVIDLPANITLVTMPPYSPELNPVERLWLFLRERFLSLRIFRDRDHIIDACCQAWNAETEDPDRIRSLCLYPWIKQVSS